MKTLYLFGNLKMNLSMEELEDYFDSLKQVAGKSNNMVGVCVPYVYLPYAEEKLRGSRVLYGVQNMHELDGGAFTGEISAKMLADFDCDLVIIGHSERRIYYNETDEKVNLKAKKALDFGFTPIVCFGETEKQRKDLKHEEVVKNQLEKAIDGINKLDVKDIIFAYEPIWAIGTGVNATSEEAEKMIKYAKSIIAKKAKIKEDEIIMLYGGSLKPNNAEEILNMPSINGGLIGGACLDVDTFKQIIDIKAN